MVAEMSMTLIAMPGVPYDDQSGVDGVSCKVMSLRSVGPPAVSWFITSVIEKGNYQLWHIYIYITRVI